MLDRNIIRQLNLSACNGYMENYLDQLDLTNRRIEAIRKKQEANPEFKAYDVWADDFVDIDTRLEEQLEVKDEIEWYINLLNDRLIILKLTKEHPNAKIVNSKVAQFSLFEAVEA